MGLFSSVMKFTGLGNLDKLTRTGATGAARDAKAAGELSLADQMALKEEFKGIYDPRIQAGNQAFQDINAFYGGDQQTIIDQAQSSPFMSSLVGQGEDAIARTSQATGGFRTGTTNENLAQNSQNVLMNLVQQILGGKQSIAQAGFGATDAYTTAMQNIVAGTGATRGEIAGIDVNQAAQRGNMLGGLFQAGATAFASDEALKNNIVKIGDKNNLPWYSWDWNELAKTIGLTGSDTGHIAQEVEKVRPDLVVMQNGFKAVIYGGF